MRKWLVVIIISLNPCLAQSGYHLTKRIPIGGDGGWDYLIADADNRRVYLSHGTQVVVLDADTGAITGKIEGLKGVHGIALAPDLSRGFISVGQSGTIAIFDLKTLKRIGDDVPAGKNPDAIVFDPATNRVFAFNGRSSDVSAIDAELASLAGTVALDGKPEFAVSDHKNAMFVNLEDKNAILRIDARKLLVEQKWLLAPCVGPSGMAMDRAKRRLFTACENDMMAVLNADDGKLVATVPICHGADATAFDPGTGMIFNSCANGSITVIHEGAPDKFEVIETIKTEAGARTMAVDLKTHKLFVPTAKFNQAPVGTGGQAGRPAMVPGSFSVLIFEK